MIRKLVLTGVLQFVQPGTGAQIFVGCIFSSISIGVQLYIQPYQEPEANILKAMVDAQIMLTFLISFMLRVLEEATPTMRSFEPAHAEFYGWLLLMSMAALVVGACGLTLAQVFRRMRFRSSLTKVGRLSSGFGMMGDDGANVGLESWVQGQSR